jgi:hypothetical protein
LTIVPAQPPQPIHWTELLSALLTPTIAIFAVVIALRQWLTAKNKLKLDLFEKRFAIFEAARLVIAKSMGSHRPTDEDLIPFQIAIISARWLFNPKIDDFLHKVLYRKLVDMQLLDMELESLQEGEERAQFVQQRAELRKQLWTDFAALEKMFAPFLQLSH